MILRQLTILSWKEFIQAFLYILESFEGDSTVDDHPIPPHSSLYLSPKPHLWDLQMEFRLLIHAGSW